MPLTTITYDTGGGGTFRIELPVWWLTPTMAPAPQAALEQGVAATATRMTQTAQDTVPWVRPPFGPVQEVGPQRVTAGFGSPSPILRYWVFGTRPHWPPWGPGSRIEGWAFRHGTTAYVAARKVSQVGTAAHPVLNQVLQTEAQRWVQAITQAVNRTLTQ